LGSFLSPKIKANLGYELDLKIILPLISTIFLDYWLRLFSHHFVKIILRQKFFSNIGFKLNFICNYRGHVPVRFKISSIEELKSINISLTWNNPIEGKQSTFDVPETFEANLNQHFSIIDFTLNCSFRNTPKPTLSLFGFQFYYFNIYFEYLVNSKIKHKSFNIFHFTRGGLK